jgi:flagellar motility protein MotE (MotC chaperone)
MQEIEIHHHFSPQFYTALERLADAHHTLAQILNNTQEIKHKMATLSEEVQSVKDAFAAGVQTITDATTAAADRVIATIQSGDPTEAVAQLEQFKTDMAAANQAEVDKLNAIDPAPAPEPTA